jgi:DNA-binding MarR family transcriptional regulator
MDQFRWLIEQRRSPQDRRRHLVQLTAAGAKQLTKADCVLSTVEAEMLGALDDSQREALDTLLQQAAADIVVNCTEAIHD